MSAFTDFLPDADVLSRAEGVERALRRGRRLGLLGWVLLAFSLAQAVAVAITSTKGAGGWPIWLAIGLFVVAFLLIAWTRIWIREAKTPFRYTYSISEFTPVEEGCKIESLAWMRHDLAERLSRRIGRLTLLREEDVTEDRAESHVHVSGVYGLRSGQVEVSPWVRIGPIDSDATLAHPVKFGRRSTADKSLSPADYEKLVERVYFSVATEIYARVRRDVERKISLLPTTYLRARAYFNEAEDYARSRTLDAYDDARDLYLGVLRLYAHDWRPPVTGRSRSAIRAAARRLGRARQRFRQGLAHVWRRSARVEVMIARAEIGYARTLLDRRILAKLSGQQVNAVFETLHVIRSAIARLEAIPEDVDGWNETLFEARTTAALAFSSLNSPTRAKEELEQARELAPGMAARSAYYQFVSSEVEPRPLVSLDVVRRALDLDPDLEVAQFSLAWKLDMLWRTRPELETSVARSVIREYERVLEINPGNIGAWASIGYLEWLLGNNEDAEHAFVRGREYKEIKHETVVSELDHGLARIAAERGDFAAAYDAYVTATAGMMAEGAPTADYSEYHFANIDLALVARFEEYSDSVRAHMRAATRTPPTDATTRRARNSVLAFALNDCAAACIACYWRTGEVRFRSRAERLLNRAAALNPRYPVIYYTRYFLAWARDQLERAVLLAPNWPSPALELVRAYAGEMVDLKREAGAAEQRADELAQRAKQLLKQATEVTEKVSAVEQQKRSSADDGDVDDTLEPDADEHRDAGAPSTRVDWNVVGERDEESRGAEGGLLERIDEPDSTDRHRGAMDATVKAAEFSDRADSEREHAGTLRARADEYARNAGKCLKELLPHQWLWLDRSAGTFDWDAPFREDVRRELRLERDLNDLQAAALFRWCQVALEDQKTTDKAIKVLKHMERRLAPDDEALLQTLMVHDPDNYDDYRARLWAIVVLSLQQDPPFWRVEYADVPETAAFADAAETDEFVAILRDLGSRRNMNPGVLVSAGEKLTQMGRHQEALPLFELAHERDAERVDTDLHDEAWYARRIAQARWSAGFQCEAVREFEAPPARDGGEPWRAAVVGRLLETRSVEKEIGFRRLQSWLLREAKISPDDAAQALDRLFDERYASLAWGRELFGFGEPAAVNLELDGPLFVRDAVQTKLPDMLKELRHDIRARTGVSVTPISIVPAAWPQSQTGDGYRLFVLDQFVADGRVQEEASAAATIKSALTQPLLAHLARLIHPDSAAEMIERWQGEDQGRIAAASTILDDDAALLLFTRVVRRLVSDHVPVHDLGVVLAETAASESEAGVDEVVARVRLRLRRPLTRMVLGAGVAEPPAEVLTILKDARDGRIRLTPFEVMLVRRALRDQLAGNGAAQVPALLVDDADLRDVVCSLARRDFPSVVVVERRELVGERDR
jgi:hypothetical protein